MAFFEEQFIEQIKDQRVINNRRKRSKELEREAREANISSDLIKSNYSCNNESFVVDEKSYELLDYKGMLHSDEYYNNYNPFL